MGERRSSDENETVVKKRKALKTFLNNTLINVIVK